MCTILLISVSALVVYAVNIFGNNQTIHHSPRKNSSFDKAFDPIYLIGSGIIGGIFLGIPVGVFVGSILFGLLFGPLIGLTLSNSRDAVSFPHFALPVRKFEVNNREYPQKRGANPRFFE